MTPVAQAARVRAPRVPQARTLVVVLLFLGLPLSQRQRAIPRAGPVRARGLPGRPMGRHLGGPARQGHGASRVRAGPRWPLHPRPQSQRVPGAGEESQGRDPRRRGVHQLRPQPKKLVFRQFHVEGFVNQYVEDAESSAARIVFTTESIENIPAGGAPGNPTWCTDLTSSRRSSNWRRAASRSRCIRARD